MHRSRTELVVFARTPVLDRVKTRLQPSLSPEQALAESALDGRSDIYSLGCVIYEMIAGTPPFLGATAQAIMSRRFLGPPPPLENARQGVPEQLSNTVMKSLAKELSDRWQTAEEFADALGGQTVLQAAVPEPEGSPGGSRKSSRNLLVGIGVGLLAITVAGVIWLSLQ